MSELGKAIATELGKSKPEHVSRLSPTISSLLNKQINNEMYSANLYKQMSAWLDANDWTGGSALFLKYGNEENAHADKIIQYMYDRNCTVEIMAVEKPALSAKTIREVLNAALAHEVKVSEQWVFISSQCLKENDFATFDLAQWFIHEQIEEENKMREFLFKLNLNMPDYELDEEFGE